MGAWIEISVSVWIFHCVLPVAPFMGAWIEILPALMAYMIHTLSHPSWVRGLK